MARKFSVLNIVLAGTIGVGMISGCNDRFGEMKARKHTRADYDKYAREHGQPTLAEIEARNAPQKPLGEDKTRRDGDSKLGPRDGGGLDDKNDQTNKGGGKPGNSNNNNNNNNNSGDTDNTDKGDGSGKTDGIDASAVSQILESPGPYPKKPWVDAFNALLVVPRPELQKVFLGVTVGSGVRDGQSKFSVRAAVKYNGQNYVLSLKPGADGKDAAEIKFDAERVTPLDIELRLTELGEVDPAASKAVRLVATCLDAAEAGTCRQIGMIVEVPQEQTARGVFKISVGNNSTVDILKTGVDQSNLGANLKPFVEGQKQLDNSKPPVVLPGGGLSGGGKPTEPAKPGTGSAQPGTEPAKPGTGGNQQSGAEDEVSDKSLLMAANLTAEGVAAGHKAALEARDQILKVNGSNKSAEEKKAEAKKLVEAASEAADTVADGADLIVRLTGHVLPNLKTPAAKERVEKMVADAKTQKAEAIAAADEAEKAAGAIVTEPWQVPFPEDKPASATAPAATTPAAAGAAPVAPAAAQPAAASSSGAPAATPVSTGSSGNETPSGFVAF